MNADLTHRIHWMAQKQQEGMKPADARKNVPKNRVFIVQTNVKSQKWLPVPARDLIHADLLIIRLCTIFRMMILSAQSLRKSDIFCFSAGFISCFAMTLRWSHDALHLRSIWARLSWSWSKSTWQEHHKQHSPEVLFKGPLCKIEQHLTV